MKNETIYFRDKLLLRNFKFSVSLRLRGEKEFSKD